MFRVVSERCTVKASVYMGCSAPLGMGQDAKSPISFSVVSIRPASAPQWISHFTEDGYIAAAIPLKSLIRAAFFPVSATQIEGIPPWNGLAFDIQAKVSEDDVVSYRKMNTAQRRLLLKALLVDQFKLKYHFEKRSEPAYALLPLRSGARVSPTTAPPSDRGADDGIVIKNGNRFIDAKHYTMPQLAWRLSWLEETNGRSVIDCTGLRGFYDFTLTWSLPDGSDATDEVGDRGAIFTSLRDELGLQLKPTKAIVSRLVIDHVEKPDSN